MLGERLIISLNMNSPFMFLAIDLVIDYECITIVVIKKGGTTGLSRPFVLTFLFFFLRRDILRNQTDYLLKYIRNDTYKQILSKSSDERIEDLIDNRVDVDLNIRYLLRYGVRNMDRIVVERIDDLLMYHNDFIKKIERYEEKLTKDMVIEMLENS